MPVFTSPTNSPRKQSPNYSEYRKRVDFVRHLSPTAVSNSKRVITSSVNK